jgi:ApaG protein
MVNNDQSFCSGRTKMIRTPYIEFTRDIEVRVQPIYLKEYSTPRIEEYVFLYKVQLINSFDDDIQLISQELTIRDGNRSQFSLEIEDVNDEQACIPAGDSYEFSSCLPIDTPTGNLRGAILARNMRTNEFFEIQFPLVFFRATKDPIERISNEQIQYAASM